MWHAHRQTLTPSPGLASSCCSGILSFRLEAPRRLGRSVTVTQARCRARMAYGTGYAILHPLFTLGAVRLRCCRRADIGADNGIGNVGACTKSSLIDPRFMIHALRRVFWRLPTHHHYHRLTNPAPDVHTGARTTATSALAFRHSW